MKERPAMSKSGPRPGALALPALLAGLLLLTAGGAAGAEVWKCKGPDGGTVFSDVPCPASGAPVEERRLRGNAIEGPRPAVATAAEPAPAPPIAQPPVNDCPGDQELRDMETRANSRSLGDKEKAFMQDEIRRVRQCRKGQGRYTAADWAISREAQAAQSSNTGAADARRRAEGMHSAADPAEGERIVQQRIGEEIADRNLARQQRARALPPPAPPVQPPCPPASGPVKNAGPCR